MAHPRALFEHPRLGRAMARAFDDAGDQALFDRARRVGYDLRTVDRAVMAWSARTTFNAAFGTFDTRRIEEQLWDRLLPPRGRAEHEGVIHVEGALGREPVALAVWNRCAFVLYAEGPSSPRAIDYALRDHDAPDAPEVEPMLRWHGRELPMALRSGAPEALLESVHDIELEADVVAQGAAVTLRLAGEVPADAIARTHHALDAFTVSALGESIGAPRWASAEHVSIVARAEGLEIRAEIPWAAIDAMADVLRGRVGEAPSP